MYLRFIFIFGLLFMVSSAFSQGPVEPTTATDGNVRIHKTKWSLFLRKAYAHPTEREGKSLKKQPKKQNWSDSKFKRQSKVLKRQMTARKKARGSKRHYYSSKK